MLCGRGTQDSIGQQAKALKACLVGSIRNQVVKLSFVSVFEMTSKDLAKINARPVGIWGVSASPSYKLSGAAVAGLAQLAPGIANDAAATSNKVGTHAVKSCTASQQSSQQPLIRHRSSDHA